MAQNTTTDDGSTALDDLQNIVPTAGFRVSSNNEEVEIYGDTPGDEVGVVKHTYEGFPAQGVVLYDVVDWEIVDYDFPHLEDGQTAEEEFDLFGEKIREWVGEALFNSDPTAAEANFYHEGTHTVRVEDPWEGDTFTVELETENKRRVR